MKMVKTTGATEEGVKKSDSGVEALPTSLVICFRIAAISLPQSRSRNPRWSSTKCSIRINWRSPRMLTSSYGIDVPFPRGQSRLSCPFLQQRDVVEVMLIGAKTEGAFGVWEICASESVANAIGVDVEGLVFSTSEE